MLTEVERLGVHSRIGGGGGKLGVGPVMVNGMEVGDTVVYVTGNGQAVGPVRDVGQGGFLIPGVVGV